jgi:hypothetical protein
MLTPVKIVNTYYESLYNGELEKVKALMTKDSYLMIVESFGLRLSFEDADFKKLLKEVRESDTSLKKVEEMLSKDLRSRGNKVEIEILNREFNGLERETVNYKENGAVKKLYFSKEKGGWKINYFAGRKVG